MAHGLGLRGLLHDHVALDEIELYAEVLIAVADTDHPLSPTEIDRALGLTSGPPVGTPSAPPPRGTATGATPAPRPTGTGTGTGTKSVVPSTRQAPNRPGPREGVSGAGFAGPIPPARDGHRPSNTTLPVHGTAPEVRDSHTLCGPFLPRFIPWRPWHAWRP